MSNDSETIIDVYNNHISPLIIYLSGFPACGVLNIAEELSKDLHLKLINQFDYFKKDYNIQTQIPNSDYKRINRYNDEAIDYNKMKEDIKKGPCIVVGFNLNNNLLPTPSIHIHLNTSKDLCLSRRKDFLMNNDNKDKYKKEYELLNTAFEKYKFNKWIYPYVEKGINESKINKFIKDTDNYDDVSQQIFDTIINFVDSQLQD